MSDDCVSGRESFGAIIVVKQPGGGWSWRMWAYRPKISIYGQKMDYKSKAMAIVQAKRIATRFGIEIVSITICPLGEKHNYRAPTQRKDSYRTLDFGSLSLTHRPAARV